MKKSLTYLLAISSVVLSACVAPGASHLHAAKKAFSHQHYRQAFLEAQTAALWKNPAGEYTLGYFYYYGIGTEKNLAESVYWIKKAAVKGDPTALRVLPQLSKQVPQIDFASQVSLPAPTAR